MTFASILLSTALLSPAQQPVERSTHAENIVAETDGGGSAMSEHIEVLRQILRQRLSRSGSGNWLRYGDAFAAYPTDLATTVPTPTTDFTPSNVQSGPFYATTANNWQGHTFFGGEPVGGVEGVYLPGYGVVFTATLPNAARGGKAVDDKPAAKPISDWERAQLELRGEKPEPAAPAGNRPPALRDTILRVLAENGRHFSRLRDDERITVVITFRDGGHSGTAYLTPSTLGSSLPRVTIPSTNQSGVVSQPLMPGLAQANPGGKTPQPSSARDYELLADLHLKQQQYQAAVDAYKRAASAYQDELKSDRHGDYQSVLSNLLARQAQAQLGLGHNDEAAELLQKAKSARAKFTPRPAENSPQSKPRVPSKLVITATKRQMDQVAQGRMAFDEFRKAATVEEE